MLFNQKNFYTFKGSWIETFEKLAGMIQLKDFQKFAIWESKNKDKDSVLIVYETALGANWQKANGVEELTEGNFLSGFKVKMVNYRIHGYNEFKMKPKKKLDVNPLKNHPTLFSLF